MLRYATELVALLYDRWRFAEASDFGLLAVSIVLVGWLITQLAPDGA